MSIEFDLMIMQRCLNLAVKGQYWVKQNPMVGCVIVKDQVIVGQGWHKEFGSHHAEVNAVKDSGLTSLSGCSVYVSLEPCAHFGKTPPCSDLLVSLKPDEVIICNNDPNPKVNGGGIAKLEAAGIKVRQGILTEEGQLLNRKFFHYYTQSKPYVTIKYAVSTNGMISGHKKNSIQISSEANKSWVHHLRATHQAIFIGARTFINDNPQLDNRLWEGNSPDIIIWDPKRILQAAELQFYLKSNRRVFLLQPGSEAIVKKDGLITISGDALNLEYFLQILHTEGIQSILVEGGAWVLNQFIETGNWQEMYKLVANNRIEDGYSGPVFNFKPSRSLDFQGDIIEMYNNKEGI